LLSNKNQQHEKRLHPYSQSQITSTNGINLLGVTHYSIFSYKLWHASE